MTAAGEFYFVVYRVAGDADLQTDGDEFETRRDAIDHRNWLFGHSPGIVACWIERDRRRIGARLTRPAAAAARDLARAVPA